MSAKGILVLCLQALSIQFVCSQCAGHSNLGAGLASYGMSTPITSTLGASSCGRPALAAPAIAGAACAAPGVGYNGLGYGNAISNGLTYGADLGYGHGHGSGLSIEVVPTSGGSLCVTSSSAIAPTGLSIVSENVIEGSVLVTGELPFLSAVALDAVLQSGGAGIVSYSLGNGVTVIDSIAPSAAAIAPAAAAYGHGMATYAPVTGISPATLSIASGGCNAAYAPAAAFAPAAGIVAPCCGYQDGIYY